MKQALGLVEIQGLSTAIVVADTMAKAANIQILEVENTKGLGYMTIKVAGDVGAVDAAVNAGRQTGISNQKLVSWKVIPRPSDYVEHMFCSPEPPGQPEPPEQPEQSIAAEAKPESKTPAEVKTKSHKEPLVGVKPDQEPPVESTAEPQPTAEPQAAASKPGPKKKAAVKKPGTAGRKGKEDKEPYI